MFSLTGLPIAKLNAMSCRLIISPISFRAFLFYVLSGSGKITIIMTGFIWVFLFYFATTGGCTIFLSAPPELHVFPVELPIRCGNFHIDHAPDAPDRLFFVVCNHFLPF
jgi:hypothetical protein